MKIRKSIRTLLTNFCFQSAREIHNLLKLEDQSVKFETVKVTLCLLLKRKELKHSFRLERGRKGPPMLITYALRR